MAASGSKRAKLSSSNGTGALMSSATAAAVGVTVGLGTHSDIRDAVGEGPAAAFAVEETAGAVGLAVEGWSASAQ